MTPALARHFHALHADGLLRLPNAWDAGSARLAHAAGARAIATSSAAVAWAHGWPDGDLLPVDLLLQTVRAVAGATGLPVTIDIEGGYCGRAGARGRARGGGDGRRRRRHQHRGRQQGSGAAVRQDRRRPRRGRGGGRRPVHQRAHRHLAARRSLRAAQRVGRDPRARRALPCRGGRTGCSRRASPTPAEIAALVAGTRHACQRARLDRPARRRARLQSLGVRRLSAGSAISEAMHGHVLAMMRTFVATGRVDTGGVAPASYGELQASMARA